MENPSPKREPWINRLDRIVREMNAFLLVLAIGLAALDFTGFVVAAVRDVAPPVARVDPSDAARRAGALGPSVAVLAPTKPGAQITGR
jgi:hypothetical protein